MGQKIKMECDICNMEYNKTEFKKHQLIHDAESYKCNHCEAAFKHKKHLENHAISKHELKVGVDEATRKVSRKLEFEDISESSTIKTHTVLKQLFPSITPKKEEKTPHKSVKNPKIGTKTPRKSVKLEYQNSCNNSKIIIPLKTPKKEIKTPHKPVQTPKTETKTPSQFRNLKVENCSGCKKSFSSVSALKLHMKNSHECGNKQMSDNINWVKEEGDPTKKTVDIHPLSTTRDSCQDNSTFRSNEVKMQSFRHIFPKSSLGSSKPKKIAYVKPQVKEVSKDDEKLKQTETQQVSIISFNIPLLNQVQQKEERFKCDQCSATFEDAWEIKEHFICRHGSEDMYHQFRRKKKEKTKMLMEHARTSSLLKAEENDGQSNTIVDGENYAETSKITEENIYETSNLGNRVYYATKNKFKNSQRSRKEACKSCEACEAGDCGVCVYCKDKPKFGGPGKMKQRCLQRICIQKGITKTKKVMLKKLEEEIKRNIQKKMLLKESKFKSGYAMKDTTKKEKRNKDKRGKKLKKEKTDTVDLKETKDEKEMLSKTPAIKLKIKLKNPLSTGDSLQNWSSEILNEDVSINEEGIDFNDRLHKIIKLESNTELDLAIASKLATKNDVDQLIKSEVDEILEMERSFREKLDDDLKQLIQSDTFNDTDFEKQDNATDKTKESSLPPKTPIKCLENTIEKLKNRIGHSQSKTKIGENEKALDMLLEKSPTPHNSDSLLTIAETLQVKDSNNCKTEDNLCYTVGEISDTDNVNIITLYPTAASKAAAFNPEIEKFEKLKLISNRIVSGELSFVSASSFTGLGEGVLRCWLEAIQKVIL